jgi:hypothetical protein
MDQGLVPDYRPLVVAARLRCVFSEPEPVQRPFRIHLDARRTPSHLVSRAFSAHHEAINIPRALPQASHEERRGRFTSADKLQLPANSD